MASRTKNPYFKDLSNFSVKYVDYVSSEDERLRLLAELLLRVNDYPLEIREIRSIAAEIELYINRKCVLEHVLFDRSIKDSSLDEIDLKTELTRIKRRFEEIA